MLMLCADLQIHRQSDNIIFLGLDPIGEPLITEMDYEGPMPTIVIPETDYYLYLSWASNIFRFMLSFPKAFFKF